MLEVRKEYHVLVACLSRKLDKETLIFYAQIKGPRMLEVWRERSHACLERKLNVGVLILGARISGHASLEEAEPRKSKVRIFYIYGKEHNGLFESFSRRPNSEIPRIKVKLEILQRKIKTESLLRYIYKVRRSQVYEW